MAYEKGDIVFNEHGQRFVYVAESDGDHIVRPTVETDEEEQWEGNPVTLKKVFASAPHEVYDETIQKLDTKVRELQEQKRALEDELRKSKQDETERKKRIMVNSALERIDDFLAGKMTHLAFHHWSGWTILTLKEALAYKESDYDSVPKGIRLLTLFGKTNGNLEWQLSSYSAHDNHPDEVYPFFSLEDAKEFVKVRFEIKWNAWRDDPKELSNAIGSARNALALDIPVPEDILDAAKENFIQNQRSVLEEKQKAYFESQNLLTTIASRTSVELLKGKK